MVEHPESDQAWDANARDETPTERLDRNWGDLLQELRVVQTGVQLLTGFLLTLPFQQRFAQLSDFQKDVYLTTVACAIVATGLLIAPVAVHRLLFRRHARRAMVAMAHKLALAGTALLGLAIVGVVLLIFDVVRGRTAATIATVVAALLLVTLWLALPLTMRVKHDVDPGGT
ncbi:MAG: hypothetical protein JO147_10460 [Actinobacteria bacterium]|nr:hypothetical protein [Actinomycetota bacterium]